MKHILTAAAAVAAATIGASAASAATMSENFVFTNDIGPNSGTYTSLNFTGSNGNTVNVQAGTIQFSLMTTLRMVRSASGKVVMQDLAHTLIS